jgi:hypothetical protein
MPLEGSGTGVITPEACVTVCLAVLEVIPDKVEGHPARNIMPGGRRV